MGIVSTRRRRSREFRARARRLAAVLAVGVLIVASMYLYDHATTADRFAIGRVELTGLSRIDREEIQRLVAGLDGQNILLAPIDAVEGRVESHPRVASASLRRVLPDRVVCAVVEREPVALVFTDRFFEIDSSGMVMAGDAYTTLLDLPTITGVSASDVRPGRVCAVVQGALEALSACKSLGGEFAAEISELRVTGSGVTIRSLRDDCVLLLGDADYEKRLRRFFLLRDDIARSEGPSKLIDLRFDNQVVVRSRI